VRAWGLGADSVTQFLCYWGSRARGAAISYTQIMYTKVAPARAGGGGFCNVTKARKTRRSRARGGLLGGVACGERLPEVGREARIALARFGPLQIISVNPA